MSELLVSNLNRGNGLAIVLNSALCIRLLSNSSLFFAAKVQLNFDFPLTDMLNNNKSVTKII